MSEVYQGRNRGGLINYVIVDDVKQLKVWGPRFEFTNFVDLLPYLDEGFVEKEGSGAIPLGVHRRERAMLLPQTLQENTTFYTVVDWEKMAEQAKGSGQPAWNYVCSQLNIPKHMTFIPSKVLLLTDAVVLSLRDQTSEQAMFMAEILLAEGFTGHYHVVGGAGKEKSTPLPGPESMVIRGFSFPGSSHHFGCDAEREAGDVRRREGDSKPYQPVLRLKDHHGAYTARLFGNKGPLSDELVGKVMELVSLYRARPDAKATLMTMDPPKKPRTITIECGDIDLMIALSSLNEQS